MGELPLIAVVMASSGFFGAGLGFLSGKHDKNPWILLLVAIIGLPLIGQALLGHPLVSFGIFFYGVIPAVGGFLIGFRGGTRNRKR